MAGTQSPKAEVWGWDWRGGGRGGTGGAGVGMGVGPFIVYVHLNMWVLTNYATNCLNDCKTKKKKLITNLLLKGLFKISFLNTS